jgi:hypothetical protein
MSLVGVILGKPGTLLPQGAQPVPQPASAGPEPLAAAAAGTNSGSTSGAGAGPMAGAWAAARNAAPQPTAAAASGTLVSAPATRRAFGEAEIERQWRLADVFAAIGGGPRAERLIEAANRPGPVAPGSLAEALKALCPAPTLETSRTV